MTGNAVPQRTLGYSPGKIVRLVSDSHDPIMGTGLILESRWVEPSTLNDWRGLVYVDVMWNDGVIHSGVSVQNFTLMPSL